MKYCIYIPIMVTHTSNPVLSAEACFHGLPPYGHTEQDLLSPSISADSTNNVDKIMNVGRFRVTSFGLKRLWAVRPLILHSKTQFPNSPHPFFQKTSTTVSLIKPN